PVLAVCGRLALDNKALKGAGIERAYALTDLEKDEARCRAQAGPLLEQLAERLAQERL
ncbi:glycerate kinase, partial [Streptomyces nanshensis]